jgi:urease accessory protein
MTTSQTNASGTIHCKKQGNNAVLTKITSTYPLRLMESKSYQKNHCVVYLLSYGGGLVSGDVIELQICLEEHCNLSILSPASQKAFKNTGNKYSGQIINASIATGALLAILPEPVVCFQDAVYKQRQVFDLAKNSSILFLDWLTAGRYSVGEIWKFNSFLSEAVFKYDNAVILHDAWLLENDKVQMVKERMGDYRCIANVVMIGPKLDRAVELVTKEHQKRVLRANKSRMDDVIWSVTALDLDCPGIVIRAASIHTLFMREFLKSIFKPLEPEIGTFFGRL